MSAQELALNNDNDDDDLGLTARQINALERLAELGAEPAVPHPDKPDKMLYNSNPQIRALQLVFEGRFGGAGRGQGRPKPVQPRAAEVLAEEIRSAAYVRKMKKALVRGLRKDAGPRVNNDTIKLSIDIERGERALQIKEEEHEDNYSGSKEDLVVQLIEALSDPAAERALEGFAEENYDDEEIEDAIVVESATIDNNHENAGSGEIAGKISIDSRETESNGTTSVIKKTRNNGRISGKNERKGSSRSNSSSKKPGSKVSGRRTTK